MCWVKWNGLCGWVIGLGFRWWWNVKKVDVEGVGWVGFGGWRIWGWRGMIVGRLVRLNSDVLEGCCMIVRRRIRWRKRGKSEEKGKVGKCERVLELRFFVVRFVVGMILFIWLVWWFGKGMCMWGINKSIVVIVCDYVK